MKFLGDLQMAIAPRECQIGGRFQGIGIARNFVKSGIGQGSELRIIENQREGPAAGLSRGLRVYQVQRLLRFRIVLVILQLPALYHSAAIGKFHAIERVLHHNGAFLRVCCRKDNRRSRRGNLCRHCGRARRVCRRCVSGSCRRNLRRLILLRRIGRRLRSKELSPKQNHRHGQKRCHQDAQLRRELVFRFSQRRQLIHRRSAHSCTSRVLPITSEFARISSHFSGTGSYPNLPDSGWHRSSRFNPSQPPRSTPNRSIASYA